MEHDNNETSEKHVEREILENEVKICLFYLGSISDGKYKPFTNKIVSKDKLVDFFNSLKNLSFWISDHEQVSYVQEVDMTRASQLFLQFESAAFLNILVNNVTFPLMSCEGQCWLEVLKILYPRLHKIQRDGHQMPVTFTYYDRRLNNSKKITTMARIIEKNSTCFIVTMEQPGIYGYGCGPTLDYHFYYLFHDGRVLPCSFDSQNFWDELSENMPKCNQSLSNWY